MNTWMMNAAITLIFVLAAIGLFFFVFTRGALLGKSVV